MDEARLAGLELAIDEGKLRIRGPRRAKGLVERLQENKNAVIQHIQFQSHSSVSVTETPKSSRKDEVSVTAADVLPSGHWLRHFDWDTTPGFCPTEPIIRDGTRHKSADCNGRECWRHVWGKRLCLNCWPPRDPAAVAPASSVTETGDDAGEPATEGRS